MDKYNKCSNHLKNRLNHGENDQSKISLDFCSDLIIFGVNIHKKTVDSLQYHKNMITPYKRIRFSIRVSVTIILEGRNCNLGRRKLFTALKVVFYVDFSNEKRKPNHSMKISSLSSCIFL